METGNAVDEEEEDDSFIDGSANAACSTGLQSSENSCSYTKERPSPSLLQSPDTCEARTTTASTAEKRQSSKKQSQPAVISQLVEEQWR